MHGSVEVLFKSDIEKIDITEFSPFMYYFRALYSVICINKKSIMSEDEESELIRRIDSGDTLSTSDGVIIDILGRLRKQFEETEMPQRFNIYHHFRKDLGNDNILLDKILKESPLEIWFYGLLTVLVISFIITGGKLELSPNKIKVEVPSLAVGLKKLREFLKGTDK